MTGGKDIDVERLLQTSWPKHHAAVTELAFHLSNDMRQGLEAAWREYYEVGRSIRFFDYYMGDNPREKFQERVNATLEFTQI